MIAIIVLKIIRGAKNGRKSLFFHPVIIGLKQGPTDLIRSPSDLPGSPPKWPELLFSKQKLPDHCILWTNV